MMFCLAGCQMHHFQTPATDAVSTHGVGPRWLRSLYLETLFLNHFQNSCHGCREHPWYRPRCGPFIWRRYLHHFQTLATDAANTHGIGPRCGPIIWRRCLHRFCIISKLLPRMSCAPMVSARVAVPLSGDAISQNSCHGRSEHPWFRPALRPHCLGTLFTSFPNSCYSCREHPWYRPALRSHYFW